jgi:hypothetical protein
VLQTLNAKNSVVTVLKLTNYIYIYIYIYRILFNSKIIFPINT